MLLRSRQFARLVLLVVDLTSLFFSFLLSWAVRFDNITSWAGQELYVTTLFVMGLINVLVFVFYEGGKKLPQECGFFENLVTVTFNQLLQIILLVFYYFVTQQGNLVSRYIVGFTYLFNVFLDFILRLLLRGFLHRLFKKGTNATNVMLITLSWEVADILKAIQSEKQAMIRISCITLLDKNKVGDSIMGIPVVGNQDNYLNTHRTNVYDEIFIHIPYNYNFKLRRLITGFEQMGVTVNLNIEVFNIDAREKRIRRFAGYQVVSFSATTMNFGQLLIKRFFDIVGSIIGLAIFLICYIIFAPIIKLTSPGPVLFAQTRVGINGRRFKIYKFRSMYKDAEKRKAELMEQNEMQGLMFKMKEDPRITPVGKLLRKTSIDELPQFWNVLKGDMSLVGTRPPTVDEYEKYRNDHMRRLSIKPGITGMWQVYGRSEVKDFEDVVRLDLSYIDNWSLLLDIKLLFMTVIKVIFGRGAE